MRISILLLLLAACSGEVTPPMVAQPDISYCTDTRDDERFAFHKDNISTYSQDIYDVCIAVIDTTGRERILCKSHEAWLKCASVEDGIEVERWVTQ